MASKKQKSNRKKRIVTRERKRSQQKSRCFFLSVLLRIFDIGRAMYNEMECGKMLNAFAHFMSEFFYFGHFISSFSLSSSHNNWPIAWNDTVKINENYIHNTAIGCGSCAQHQKNQTKIKHILSNRIYDLKRTNNAIFYMDIFVKYLRPCSLNVMCANIQRRWSGRRCVCITIEFENVCAFL